MGELKQEYTENGYADCVQLIRDSARDDRITEGELKQIISCQGKYKEEEEKREILNRLKE